MKLPKTNVITYTILKAAQLFSLLALGLSTTVTWVIEIYLALELSLESYRKHKGFNNPESVNEYVASLTSTASAVVLRWLIISAILTGLLLIFRRIRKHGKSYIVSSCVFIIFCFIATAFAQDIIEAQLVKIISI